MSRRMHGVMTYYVVPFGLVMILIAGCGRASTNQPVSTSPVTETEPNITTTFVVTETKSATDSALPTVEPTVVPSLTVGPTETKDLPATEAPVVKTPETKPQMSKNKMVAAVKADLASRLGISPDLISLVRAEAVTWNDASLGCPEKGQMYAQVLTPGYQIILKYEATEYDYRTNDVGFHKLCR